MTEQTAEHTPDLSALAHFDPSPVPHAITLSLVRGGRKTAQPLSVVVTDLDFPGGYKVESERHKGQYYFVMVQPHKRSTCTCEAGLNEFAGCTVNKVCKHVLAARIRHTHRLWPSTAASLALQAEYVDKLYPPQESNPPEPVVHQHVSAVEPLPTDAGAGVTEPLSGRDAEAWAFYESDPAMRLERLALAAMLYGEADDAARVLRGMTTDRVLDLEAALIALSGLVAQEKYDRQHPLDSVPF